MKRIAYELNRVNYRIGRAMILDGVSLTVTYGKVLVLIGPNGAGKSTLLGLLAGDGIPTSGGILLNGRPLNEWKPVELSQARGVLLQTNQVSFPFTARQIIEMGRAPWIGSPRAFEDRDAIANAIAQTHVGHVLARPYQTLSGGERARVALARVLAQNTSVLLLDEPTAALDLRHQEDALKLVRSLAAEGRAVAVVLHDLSLAAAYADDIAMLDRGCLRAFGPPENVITAEHVQAVYGTPVHIIPDPDTGRPLVVPKRTR